MRLSNPRKTLKFDDTDSRIIRNLQRDARTNFASIAKECGVSVDTIIKRLEKLQRFGAVKGTTILINPRMTGYDGLASMEINAEPIHVNEVVAQMRKILGVTFCTPTMGVHNIFAVAICPSVKELNSLRESVKLLPYVRDVKTSIWIEDVLLCPENFELDQLKK